MDANLDMNSYNIQEIDKAYFDSGAFISSDDSDHLDIHADYIDLHGNLSTIWDVRLNTDGNGSIGPSQGNLVFGSGGDTYLYYNGSDFIIDPDAVGSGDVFILGDIRADNFIGDGSQLTNIGGFNLSWNQTWADTLYADIGVTGDNSSFNQILTDTMYANLNVTGDNESWSEVLARTIFNTSWNQTWADTQYADIAITGDNESWTQALADTLYADIAIVGDNSSWTQALADTLYADISVVSNPFDQVLNTTSNPTFNNQTITNCIVFGSGGSICSGS